MDDHRKDGGDDEISHGQRRKPRPGDPDHPGRKNLRPWKKGESGNPGGCPKGHGPSLHKAIRLLLDQPATILRDTKLEGKTVRDALAISTITHAMKGKAQYLEMIWDRLWGPVPVRMEQKQGSPDDEIDPEVAAAGLAAMLKAAKEGATEE